MNYRDVETAISNRTDFKHSSCYGKNVKAGVLRDFGMAPNDAECDMKLVADNQDCYVVVSYDTPIAVASGKNIVIPEVKYSSTTSRQQNLCRNNL